MVMTAFQGIDLYSPDAYARESLEKINSRSLAVAMLTLLQSALTIFLASFVISSMILPALPDNRAARFKAISKKTFFKTFAEFRASVRSTRAPPDQLVY